MPVQVVLLGSKNSQRTRAKSLRPLRKQHQSSVYREKRATFSNNIYNSSNRKVWLLVVREILPEVLLHRPRAI